MVYANNITNVIAEDVKCDNKSELCEKYPIRGYPSVILIKNKEMIEYNGPRTVEGLKTFLSRYL